MTVARDGDGEGRNEGLIFIKEEKEKDATGRKSAELVVEEKSRTSFFFPSS